MGQKATGTASRKAGAQQTAPPRVLIEEWLPAAAIGVECTRERSTGQQPPDKRLHVWWARRPLCVSRAAVLASLLPAGFPRDVFERLLGFWGPSQDILRAQALLDWKKQAGGLRIRNPHEERAFRAKLDYRDLDRMDSAIQDLWGNEATVIDPMAGGGSIPLECARLGIRTLANEYNPVACAVLEATVDYPFRFGEKLADRAKTWGRELRKRFNARVKEFFPATGQIPPLCYMFARTVPCPDTGLDTPLVPDWHLLKPKNHSGCGESCLFAVPIVDRDKGTWTIRVQQGGRGAGQAAKAPLPTYSDGKGVSLFSGKTVERVWQGQQIPADYILTSP